jgi:hypothetical protein
MASQVSEKESGKIWRDRVEWSHVGTCMFHVQLHVMFGHVSTRGTMFRFVRVILSLHNQTRTFPTIIGYSPSFLDSMLLPSTGPRTLRLMRLYYTLHISFSCIEYNLGRKSQLKSLSRMQSRNV